VDWLSTAVAPPLACLSAVLIAIGFILPHAGQYLHGRWHVRLAHHELRPLYLLMRTVNGEGIPFLLRGTPELRLVRRETFIRDVLLPLARHIDEDRRERFHDAALALGHPPDRAKVLAATAAILDAADTGSRAGEDDGTGARDTTELLREIGALSRALRHKEDLRAIRALARDHSEGRSLTG
jgi:hypothetical protein